MVLRLWCEKIVSGSIRIALAPSKVARECSILFRLCSSLFRIGSSLFQPCCCLLVPTFFQLCPALFQLAPALFRLCSHECSPVRLPEASRAYRPIKCWPDGLWKKQQIVRTHPWETATFMLLAIIHFRWLTLLAIIGMDDRPCFR